MSQRFDPPFLSSRMAGFTSMSEYALLMGLTRSPGSLTHRGLSGQKESSGSLTGHSADSGGIKGNQTLD